MSMSQLDRWFRAVGCERASQLIAPPELRDRRGYYLPVAGETRPGRSTRDRLVKRVILTTPTLDRQGDIVVPTGVSLKWFKKNPVVLWAHRYDQPPVGAVDVDALKVTDKGIEADVVFDAGSAVGREVYGLYDRGVMRAWSIGFVPLKWQLIEDPDTNRVKGYRIEEWELLELSAVPVPANPEALTRHITEMESRGYDPRLLPVLNALKSAVGSGADADSPEPVPGRPAARAKPQTENQIPKIADPHDLIGHLDSRIAKLARTLEKRLGALEASEPRQRGAAADRRREPKGRWWVDSIAEEIAARLPHIVSDLVTAEFDRRRGVV